MLISLILSLQPAVAITKGDQPRFELSVEHIMKSAAWVGHAPRGLRWSEDGQWLRFSWAKASEAGQKEAAYKDYVVRFDGTGLKEGVPPEFKAAAPRNVPQVERLKPKFEVSVVDNDLYLLNLATQEKKRLTQSPESKSNPQVTDDGGTVVYMHDGNLFSLNVADGKTLELTHLKPEPYPLPAKTSEDALAKEEAEFFKDLPPAGIQPGAPKTDAASGSNPGRRGRFRGLGDSGFTLAADGVHAYFQVNQSPPNDPATVVPNYITKSGYTEILMGYAKVGELAFHSKLEVVNVKTGTMTEIACPRPGFVRNLSWSPDGTYAFAEGSADDHKDNWIFGFDPKSDQVKVLWDEHDDAWVGGPGRGLADWLPDSSRIYFESEKTGYSHLMTVTPEGKVEALTSGPFEVSSVRLDAPRNRFVFVSSEGSPFKRHIDALSFNGGKPEKLADFSADEDATFALSPDGKQVAVVRSSSNRPSELFVNGFQVTTTPNAAWLAGPWIDPPVVMVPARDGIKVPARLYKPKRWRRGGPAVIFIHGAGYLQNVYDGWSHYFREYMFHHLLMNRGYAVLDIDYRGSAGYGKAWRTAIYRHMGGKDLDDAVDGAKYLEKELGVDPKRVGIYGGSYGGFLTLMALFTASDTFSAGAALRPVSDWANYNHGYTSQILNLPQDDPEAYRQSSPIYFADGLKGALLICHGMVDTNVQFQDTVRLIERLIELGKKNWSVAPYPIEDHAFRTPESWTDEYSRILDLFDRNIGPGYRKR
jgi:dipeptidyl aminopeptidase/acylaminoacyl peptidase